MLVAALAKINRFSFSFPFVSNNFKSNLNFLEFNFLKHLSTVGTGGNMDMLENNKTPGSFLADIKNAAKDYPRRSSKFIGYGTAGFRDKAENLEHIMFRVGALAALRSKQKSATVGAMITASHNPAEDNGCKLVDPHGEMLTAKWEEIATVIGNVKDDGLAHAFKMLVEDQKININAQGSIFIGQDTRESCPRLFQCLIDGIRCIGNTEIVDYHQTTTPMLHYLVVCRNGKEAYGECSKDGYYTKISKAFLKLFPKEGANGGYIPQVSVDCANGVGAYSMQEFVKRIAGSALQVEIVNDGTSGKLNHECGADYVKTKQIFPERHTANSGQRYCSLDGDADRLIYYYLDDDLKFHLLDGDKIALLLVDYMSELVKKSNLTLNFGIIQTAYANGNATKYATSLGIPVTCAPTGVKYLHRAAQDYDVGVYFEANGHGTVVFSDKAREEVRKATLAGNEGAKELGLFMDVINSTVGDAISDMLCVETALRAKGWDPKRWEAMYFDLPSRLLTVTVLNREWVETTDAEREVTKPVELARKLKSVAKKYPPTARAFVRPSGTEEIVRVYAEAEDQETADQYAAEVEKAVIKYCGIIPDDTPIF